MEQHTTGTDTHDERGRFSFESVCAALHETNRQVEDAVLGAVPPEVTQHLVNARKELLQAGQRAIDLAMQRLDHKAQRAWDIHREREAARSGSAPPPAPAPAPAETAQPAPVDPAP